ncbi:hypothetical protein [Caldicellulosiruptor obsidiansis]|nr:hypothetical protein [Caldicellulosiruptor obsidiansis]
MEKIKEGMIEFKEETSKKIENLIEVTEKTKEEYGRHDIDLRIIKEKI